MSQKILLARMSLGILVVNSTLSSIVDRGSRKKGEKSVKEREREGQGGDKMEEERQEEIFPEKSCESFAYDDGINTSLRITRRNRFHEYPA